MNTGIFPAVCRPLYPTEGFYSISIEIELNARIEKKISDQWKMHCTLNMCVCYKAHLFQHNANSSLCKRFV